MLLQLHNMGADSRARSALRALSCASRADVCMTFVFAARKLGRRLLTFLFVLQRIEKDERASPSAHGVARTLFSGAPGLQGR